MDVFRELTDREFDIVTGGSGAVAAVVAFGTVGSAAAAQDVVGNLSAISPPGVNEGRAIGGFDAAVGAAH